jgi:regulatory protein
MEEKKKTLQKALNKAYFFLKFRPRSKQEVINYLSKKAGRFKWPAEVVDGAVAVLEEEGLINDKDFVDWYVNKSSKIKIQSSRLMIRNLMKFGVDKFLIEDFFYKKPTDDERTAFETLSRSWWRWGRLSKMERFKKSSSFLQRRGFSYAIIKKTIDKLEEKE